LQELTKRHCTALFNPALQSREFCRESSQSVSVQSVERDLAALFGHCRLTTTDRRRRPQLPCQFTALEPRRSQNQCL